MNLDDLTAMPGQSLSGQYVRKFGLAFLVIALLFLALIANQMYVSHLTAQESATTNAKNLVLVLESKLSIDFEAAHSAVSAMALEIGPDAMRQEEASKYRPQITQLLKSRIRNIRSASALRYFDASGDLLYSSLDSDTPFSIADRTFFQRLRDDPAQSVIFSEVIIGRSTNRASVIVDKAIHDKDGSFLGVATTAIDVKSLHDDFSNISLGKDGTVVLRRLENGAAVVRVPGPVEVDNAPFANIPIRQTILKDGPTGAIGFVSPVDGIRRIYGYRTVGSFPFFVAIGISESSYLSEWRRNLVTTLLASVLFLAILAAVLFRLARAKSQRDRSESEHRWNERRLQQILLSITEGLIFQDQNGVIIDVNPAAEQLLGATRADLLGRSSMDSDWQAVTEDHCPFPGHLHPAMAAVRTGQPVKNQILGISVPGRGLRWMSISTSPILAQGEAAPITVVTTFTDVTERKQANTDLRIAAAAFESQEGMMVTDTDGVILRVNRAFTEMTGYSAADALGQTPRLLQSGYHDSDFYRKMWDAIGSAGWWQGEIWERRKNGQVYPKLLTISAVKDDAGVITHYVGAQYDITERKNAEVAMLNLNRDLSESRQRVRGLAAQNEEMRESERKHIAREVHDELGQVLTALRMDISLIDMRFGSLDPAVTDKVMDMRKLVDRAIQGVRNVAMNLRPPALDMGLVPAIHWLSNEFSRNTTIKCVLNARKGHIDLEEARAVVVFRIVQESLTNVTRYAEASLVNITIGHRGNELWVEVRDNGRGFDVDVVTKGKSFGLLGMRERALALGGQVHISSVLGQGTVIGLMIPIELGSAEEKQ